VTRLFSFITKYFTEVILDLDVVFTECFQCSLVTPSRGCKAPCRAFKSSANIWIFEKRSRYSWCITVSGVYDGMIFFTLYTLYTRYPLANVISIVSGVNDEQNCNCTVPPAWRSYQVRRSYNFSSTRTVHGTICMPVTLDSISNTAHFKKALKKLIFN